MRQFSDAVNTHKNVLSDWKGHTMQSSAQAGDLGVSAYICQHGMDLIWELKCIRAAQLSPRYVLVWFKTILLWFYTANRYSHPDIPQNGTSLRLLYHHFIGTLHSGLISTIFLKFYQVSPKNAPSFFVYLQNMTEMTRVAIK